jgi:hypothetical protein
MLPFLVPVEDLLSRATLRRTGGIRTTRLGCCAPVILGRRSLTYSSLMNATFLLVLPLSASLMFNSRLAHLEACVFVEWRCLVGAARLGASRPGYGVRHRDFCKGPSACWQTWRVENHGFVLEHLHTPWPRGCGNKCLQAECGNTVGPRRQQSYTALKARRNLVKILAVLSQELSKLSRPWGVSESLLQSWET